MKLNNFWRTKLLVFLAFIYTATHAQHSWVYLIDKCDTTTDYFSTNVCEDYLNIIKQTGASVVGTSKWLNATCIDNNDIKKLDGLACVAYIQPMGNYTMAENSTDEDYGYGLGDWQIEMLNLHQYHKLGNTGRDVTIALFDGGFWKVDSLPIFDSFWAQNQIKAAYDFVDNTELTYNQSTHGMQVLALAGINYPDSMVGAAPSANFVLARTEDTYSETHLEELNWLRAMEWADSVGVDIIHSSLGYSLFDTLQGDYSYQDMDGKSTIITIAAEEAVKRGIFVTNSAGNSGNDPWYYITAPCDGINVLCVGAVDSFEKITSFSSRGPSADGRVKPDIVAMGARNTIPNANGILRRGSGTSFSGPLVAGLVACLKGAHPSKNNNQILEAVKQSCDKYNAPNNAYGYGLPDVLRADSILEKMPVLLTVQLKNLEVEIYPNPVTNVLHIRTAPGSTYDLIDYQGNTLKQGKLENWLNFIPVRDIPKGGYILRVKKDNTVRNTKIVLH